MFIFGQHTSLWVDLDDPEGLPELSTVSECSTRDNLLDFLKLLGYNTSCMFTCIQVCIPIFI